MNEMNYENTLIKHNRENFRNFSIYSVFVRNFSKEGTFKKVEEKLVDIKKLGFDAVWLMPIHPVGEFGKKGSEGSPYAIKDYYAVNPKFGSLDDFQSLIDSAHDNNLKVMIDVVYNHTSRDSVLLEEHPEWFYKNNGNFGNKVGDWSDVYDLDFNNKDLWVYLFNGLKKWVDMGVDGFRCDVAPLIPLDFWKYVRLEFNKIGKEDLILLSESVEPSFIKFLRSIKQTAHSDSEMYQVFDMLYDYDIKEDYLDFINGKSDINSYLKSFIRQEFIYPADYVKMRNIENHDNPRGKELIKDRQRLLSMTSFLMYMKGAYLFYNGQETMSDHYISLFENEPIEWIFDADVIDITKDLLKIKKEDFIREGNLDIKAVTDNTAKIIYEYQGSNYIGYFNIGLKNENIVDIIEKDTLDIDTFEVIYNKFNSAIITYKIK